MENTYIPQNCSGTLCYTHVGLLPCLDSVLMSYLNTVAPTPHLLTIVIIAWRVLPSITVLSLGISVFNFVLL